MREELQQIDPRTRKLMTIYTILHPRDDVDRLYVTGKERGRAFKGNVDASIQQLEDYLKKRRRLIIETRNNTDNISVTAN